LVIAKNLKTDALIEGCHLDKLEVLKRDRHGDAGEDESLM